jgi:hypothetical protein
VLIIRYRNRSWTDGVAVIYVRIKLKYHSPEEWQLVLEEDANINLNDQFIQSIFLNTSVRVAKREYKDAQTF